MLIAIRVGVAVLELAYRPAPQSQNPILLFAPTVPALRENQEPLLIYTIIKCCHPHTLEVDREAGNS